MLLRYNENKIHIFKMIGVYVIWQRQLESQHLKRILLKEHTQVLYLM